MDKFETLVIKDTTDKKMSSLEGIANENMKTDDGLINEEQESVINKLEEALSILKSVKIKNKESFVNVKKPLDDFLSSLKYLPVEPSFEILPTEIKADILSYLCDTGTFVTASVCREWKGILETKIKNMKRVTIGKHCNCEENKCFMPEEILKASISLKLDIPLFVCHPIADIDTDVIIEALTNVSSFRIEGGCLCVTNDSEDEPILNTDQFDQLFSAIEKKDWSPRVYPMEGIDLRLLDLTGLNQTRLINCLLNNTEALTLDEGEYGSMLDNEMFFLKLSKDTLPFLRLFHFDYPYSLSETVADAVCNVFILDTWPQFHFTTVTLKRLIQNILRRPRLDLRCLDIGEQIDWREVITPENLKILLNKLHLVQLRGNFTPDQVEIAKSLPGAQASSDAISKKSDQ